MTRVRLSLILPVVEPRRTGKFSGQKIQEARSLCGMTREELADAVKTTKTSVYNWENGVYFPKADVLMKMADVLGQSTSFFFVPIGEQDGQ